MSHQCSSSIVVEILIGMCMKSREFEGRWGD
jgi:hypothetical protein